MCRQLCILRMLFSAIKTVSLGRILRTGKPSQRHEDNQSLMALLDGHPTSFADGEDSR
jgi:hypothetical protein